MSAALAWMGGSRDVLVEVDVPPTLWSTRADDADDADDEHHLRNEP
jgi:hypothetical protein